jgi:hypothetical protein
VVLWLFVFGFGTGAGGSGEGESVCGPDLVSEKAQGLGRLSSGFPAFAAETAESIREARAAVASFSATCPEPGPDAEAKAETE